MSQKYFQKSLFEFISIKTISFILLGLFLGYGLTSSSPVRAEEKSLDELVKLTANRSVVSGGVDLKILESVMKRGLLIIVDETTGEKIPWLVSAGITIDTPAENAFNTFIDFARYPEWMAQTEKASVKVTGNRAEVEHTLLFKLGFIPYRIHYTVTDRIIPPRRVDWVGTGGDLKETYGYMELFPVEAGKKTMFYFTSWTTPESIFLRKFIEGDPTLDLMISVSSASVYVKNLKTRLEKVKAAPPAASAPEPDFSQTPVETLIGLSSRGPVVLFEDPTPEEAAAGVSPQVTSWIIFNLPPEAVYRELADFPAQVGYISILDDAKWLSRNGQSGEMDMHFQIKLPIYTKKLHTQMAVEFTPNKKITWKYLRGDQYTADGSWELIPLAGGTKTLGILRNRYSFSSMGSIADYVLKSVPDAPVAIKAILSSVWIRAARDWAETPASEQEKLKALKKKKRLEEIRRLAESRLKK